MIAAVRLRRFLLTLSVPALLVGIGTAGYVLVEGWSVLDALYMTVITITTVGFREVHDISSAGKVFTMLLALGGIFTLLAAAMEIIRAVVSGEVRRTLGRQRMERSLTHMKDHLIVCGYGRLGRHACQEFSRQGLDFVVVDRDASILADFTMPHGIPLVGDATSDEILRAAGVERARVLLEIGRASCRERV
jgi:voltage-gated potassium channel